MEDGADPHSGEEPQKPEAVVVAPTRELAIQIKEEARKFASGTVLKPVVVYGGTSVGFQLSNMFKGKDTFKNYFLHINFDLEKLIAVYFNHAKCYCCGIFQ